MLLEKICFVSDPCMCFDIFDIVYVKVPCRFVFSLKIIIIMLTFEIENSL